MGDTVYTRHVLFSRSTSVKLALLCAFLLHLHVDLPDGSAAIAAFHRPAPPLIFNNSYADRVGGTTVRAWSDGRFNVQLRGWGRLPLVSDVFSDIAVVFEQLGEIEVAVLLDMRRGTGSSPLAVRAAIHFLREHGHRISHCAVIAPWPMAVFMRTVAAAAHQEGVGYFTRPQPAQAWLHEQTGKPSRS
eukprot:TRINITY_DN50597_c0_g1_i1.p1 TRINITY_DN50597_c0_g1~~TRINITY_DN50597_c0_g1_i1.p1  ORF type:complete len:212 (-),score=23.98 TRINITY_DN50597_c0_g1_i1:148-711(-)